MTKPMTTPEPQDSKGLRFFSPGDSPAYRRRRLTFLLIYAVAILMVTIPWPGVWGIHPTVFGLPTSFAWVFMAIVVVFASLIWLSRSERYSDSVEGEK